jgi:beta-glucosidase-like glycosyl hydrolase/CubicO group peptidase (beta-lactamase class C family)
MSVRKTHHKALFYMAYPIALMGFVLSFSANRNLRNNYSTALDNREAAWVDSVFRALTPEQRIGQLFMLRAHSDKDETYEADVEQLIRKFQPGGLCFFQGTPEKQAELTNRYQEASKQIPLLISMDAEWGLGMRLKGGAISYPKQLPLGAIQDDALLYDMGVELARQCRRIGVHINFAPVVDVNNNPDNPVIHERSFGEDMDNVARKGVQYTLGMQAGGLIACAKHFPGHGDTDVDSHEELPVINHPLKRLDSLELYPFRALVNAGVGAIMVAHLHVPALDNRKRRPTTLSRHAITDLLRRQMRYDGLIITDAMEMKGVAKYFESGDAEVEALKAGNDIILLPGNAQAAFQAIQSALRSGELDRGQLDASVRRILRAKYRLGLTHKPHIDLFGIPDALHTPQANMLKRRLLEHSLTLVRDNHQLCGFPRPEGMRIAALALSDSNAVTPFQTMAGWYAPIDHFVRAKIADPASDDHLLDTLRSYDVVLISLHQMPSKAALQYGVTPSLQQFVERILQLGPKVGMVVFGTPYSLRYFDRVPLLLCAYNDEPLTQELAAQALFGAVDIQGKLPISASPNASYGQGMRCIYPDKRLAFDLPESVGMDPDTLALLDELVSQMIGEGATPGCQILVAKNNRIVYHKAFGYHTYERLDPVRLDNLYDLASVTKVAATNLAMMQLTEQGCVSLQLPLGTFLPEARGTNKDSLTLEDILAHHAGLVSWIPFYESTLSPSGLPNQHIYHRQPDEDSPIPVASNMYMTTDRLDSVWQAVFQSELRERRNYRYSDLGLFLCARMVEHQTSQTLDAYVDAQFYRPLGLSTTAYNPWKRGWAARCVPTEEDRYFRQQRIQGYVHDMGAAMLGGVAGHAGLFSNACDVAKIFQMLLNGGHYAGHRFLQPETVANFATRYHRSSRRGLGFDMKELDERRNPNMGLLAGANTFGHLGFTGNAAWADPDQQLIFVFLSNRTYPTMHNNKLMNSDYRIKLQDIVYRAILPTATFND